MTALRATTSGLNLPRRTVYEVLARVPRSECEEATFRRVCAHGSITLKVLLVADDHMHEMLEAALLPAKPGMPYPNDVRITGRLTARQWSSALTVSVFAAADYLPYDRCPEDHPRMRTRSWLGIDWLRDPNLPGATTTEAVCTLTATAAGKTFTVEVVCDDTASVLV